MARFYDPTPEQHSGWNEWVASRPENVRAVAEKFDPWSLFLMPKTGQRCTIVSFGEADNGSVTLTVNITGEYNLTVFDRQVFGVDPSDLEPCDIPAPTEPVGTMLTNEGDVESFLNAVRPMVLAGRMRS